MSGGLARRYGVPGQKIFGTPIWMTSNGKSYFQKQFIANCKYIRNGSFLNYTLHKIFNMEFNKINGKILQHYALMLQEY